LSGAVTKSYYASAPYETQFTFRRSDGNYDDSEQNEADPSRPANQTQGVPTEASAQSQNENLNSTSPDFGSGVVRK
jgi:hypothetical protein